MTEPTDARPTAALQHPPGGWLAHMPVPLFASVMGLTGLTIAWKRAEESFGWPHAMSSVLMFGTLTVYALLLVLYAAKLVRHPGAVKHEFSHPVRISFFPAISIGALLLAIPTKTDLPELSLALVAFGAALHLGLTIVILSSWIHHTRYEIVHSTPAWFIPIVGNIIVPIPAMAHGYVEIAWFFFSIGFLFWIVLLTIMMNRFFFHPPVPSKLLPTLFILIAPPAIGCLSWLALHHGAVDDLARVLYYVGLFTTMLLLYQLPHFTKLPFALPWWAYSFPSAAITIATLAMARGLDNAVLRGLGMVLLFVITALIGFLFVRTLIAIRAGKVFVPE